MNGEQYTARESIYGSAIIGWRKNVFSETEKLEIDIINKIMNNAFTQLFA